MISEYTGLNFHEVLSLGLSEYMLYRHDAWLSGLKATDEGREFLKTLSRLQTTEADTKAIEEFNERRPQG